MKLNAREYDWQALNNAVRDCAGDVEIENCLGERFIGCGASKKQIKISGVPGNGLGAYLDGGEITCLQNVQDAVGDTMNDGKIVVHGSAGDALGYAMRGGSIYVSGNSGYRTGIHMKEYMSKRPTIVVGGKTGSFLGEYLAGGLIIVLGLGCDSFPAGGFTGTGMHGGEIWIRSDAPAPELPKQVLVSPAEDISPIMPYLSEFSKLFGVTEKELCSKGFYRLTPNAKSPYKRLYTPN